MSSEFRCDACDGYGVIRPDSDRPCPRCGGSGLKDAVDTRNAGDRDDADLHLALDLPLPAETARRRARRLVTLPEGIGEGTVLRLRSLGSPGGAGTGDLYLHIGQAFHPVDRRPGARAARPEGPSPAASPSTEREAIRAVETYFSTRWPGQAPIVTFVWRCDHGMRSRCSTAAVWHVRANDQVCTVYGDGHVEPAFASLLGLKHIRRPSYDELAALNPELGLKSPEAVTRLLDIMEGRAKWDGQSRRFVCTDSGWVTTAHALDYYVDDPELWQKRAEEAAKAAIDDEMEEWERASQQAALERLTALLGTATSGAGSPPAPGTVPAS